MALEFVLTVYRPSDFSSLGVEDSLVDSQLHVLANPERKYQSLKIVLIKTSRIALATRMP